jgi:hypothetical protein
MKKQLARLSIGVLLTGMVFSACKKDKTEENEEEVITTVALTFLAQGSTTPLVYTYDDADGPGGSNPVINDIVLAPNKTYSVSIAFLNKTVNPVENITEEVEEENKAHRIYYQPSAGVNLAVSNLNNDDSGLPLGLTSTWTTTAASTGTIKITLRHYAAEPPNKAANDPVDSPKSSTDADPVFTVKVQ